MDNVYPIALYLYEISRISHINIRNLEIIVHISKSTLKVPLYSRLPHVLWK